MEVANVFTTRVRLSVGCVQCCWLPMFSWTVSTNTSLHWRFAHRHTQFTQLPPQGLILPLIPSGPCQSTVQRQFGRKQSVRGCSFLLHPLLSDSNFSAPHTSSTTLHRPLMADGALFGCINDDKPLIELLAVRAELI